MLYIMAGRHASAPLKPPESCVVLEDCCFAKQLCLCVMCASESDTEVLILTRWGASKGCAALVPASVRVEVACADSASTGDYGLQSVCTHALAVRAFAVTRECVGLCCT